MVMDGSRIRELLTSDVKSLLSLYRQFEGLIPHHKHRGAAHTGEDGRYVEALVREYLSQYLPKSLRVSTGFILRPAVKTGLNGRERRGDKDQHSTQLDIIIHDHDNYPVFQKFGNNVIVPPESVIALISVKKHLRPGNVKSECEALSDAANLCNCLDPQGNVIRGPFLALVSMGFPPDSEPKNPDIDIWSELQDVYNNGSRTFDALVGYIGAFGSCSVFKARPVGNPVSEARFVWHDHSNNEHHLGLQFILTGILSVYYDEFRNIKRRPGFTGFESGRPHEKELGRVLVSGLR